MGRSLVLIVSFGVCLALAGCGDEDDSNGGPLGHCEGGDLPLAGGCDFGDGTCSEIWGDFGGDLPTACAKIGGTFIAACPEVTKSSGGCVMAADGGVDVLYLGDTNADDFQRACENMGFCYFGG